MPDRAGPIIAMAIKLRSRGVPSIGSLVAQLDTTEEFTDFLKLVDELLPERRQDILSETTPAAQIALFASYFEDRYFPLHEYLRYGDITEYRELTFQLPVIVRGITYDDFHEMPGDVRAGIQLMTFLVRSPYDETEGASAALAEACLQHVSQEIIERAAPIQLEPDEAHKLLNETQFEQLAYWADRLHMCTNNFFLDTDDEMLGYNIMGWDRGTVEDLTNQWHQAEAAENRLYEFVEWLEADPRGRFEQMVNFIEERRANG